MAAVQVVSFWHSQRKHSHMHTMNVYGRVPWEASMEYFIKKQTNRKLKAHSKLSKQHFMQII